jgi:hypothetical protein
MMSSVMLGAMLSLIFFSAVLIAEMKGGDTGRAREVAVILGVLTLVAGYASHAVLAGRWPQIASLAALVVPGS